MASTIIAAVAVRVMECIELVEDESTLTAPHQAGEKLRASEERLHLTLHELRVHQCELEMLNEDLASFNRVAVDRELRMIELKKEINALCAAVGQAPRYPIDSGGAPS